MTYSPERLAYWYFRLNGFLTIENFIVHPDTGSDQRTDADLLAVRFMHRAENVDSPMQDDLQVAECGQFANVIITEIKTGRCALNGPWTNPAHQNMERLLRAIGCVDSNAIAEAAQTLYNKGVWRNETSSVRLFAMGEDKSQLIVPEEQQLTWSDVIDFFKKRFREYRWQKSSVGQWTVDGRRLQNLALRRDDAAIRRLFGLQLGRNADA